MTLAKGFTSPLQRASGTCELAGFGDGAETDPDLVEWDYGNYEGLTSAQILEQYPNWDLFRDGALEGDSPAQTVWLNVSVTLRVMCRYFRADTLFGCSLRAGWASVLELVGGIFC